ncbi:preprotein translocase subunit SecF [Scopulibacillus daqui]|uniref:Preprotein translocase subunit SecF n=1 Tax=Scopulibacillus daqui TaxID=1469162 RepID=A0ABS2PYJ6_9BACL|nr:hypothetical protein [Scopulibacillus daqui]MBM7645092.1 preprotein translocase subunit SecF [Scopulibacillus daqui]
MKKWILSVFAIILVLGIVSFYFNSGFKMRSDFEKSINHMIQEKDKQAISRVTHDRKTYDFLMKLPKGTTCKKSSDAQGSDGKTVYFVTDLDNKNIGLYIKKENRFLSNLFPKWEVVSIRL